MTLMSPEQLERNLIELARRLNAVGQAVDVYLVGGAAMSIGFDPNRRLTTDIDAKIKNFEAIKPLIAEIAQDFGLADDWLNNTAAKLVSQMAQDNDWLIWKTVGQVNIYTASAELLLVMKAAASGPKKDGQDLIVLLRKLEI